VAGQPALSAFYSDCIFSRLSLPSQNPKQQTVEWVSDGYLTQTQQCSVIAWRKQTNFKWDDVRFVLDQNT
jgi:hypothetical protein